MAPSDEKPFTVAAAQISPVFMDREKTIDKACETIAEAAKNGAKIVVFPEALVPGYPDWVWVTAPGVRGDIHAEMYGRLLDQAVTIPSAATDKLCRAAKSAGAYVVMGISERNAEASGASMYNTLLYVDAQGNILGKHRKLVPTGGERLVWAQGDGSTLNVYDTPFGKIGGLICWENYMPLARYCLYAWGVQLYVAATWDRGQPWLSTLRHIAKEGRVYVLSSCIALRKDDIPGRYPFKQRFYGGEGEWVNVGDSAIVNPDGEFVAGPVRMKEEILYAEIDPKQMRGPKWMLDVAGHYGRPDVFELIVHREPRPMIATREAEPPALSLS